MLHSGFLPTPTPFSRMVFYGILCHDKHRHRVTAGIYICRYPFVAVIKPFLNKFRARLSRRNSFLRKLKITQVTETGEHFRSMDNNSRLVRVISVMNCGLKAVDTRDIYDFEMISIILFPVRIKPQLRLPLIFLPPHSCTQIKTCSIP